MSKVKRKKEQPSILYERYKKEHYLNAVKETAGKGATKKITSGIKHAVAIVILTIMIFLSAIGVIALLNAPIRAMLMQLVGI